MRRRAARLDFRHVPSSGLRAGKIKQTVTAVVETAVGPEVDVVGEVAVEEILHEASSSGRGGLRRIRGVLVAGRSVFLVDPGLLPCRDDVRAVGKITVDLQLGQHRNGMARVRFSDHVLDLRNHGLDGIGGRPRPFNVLRVLDRYPRRSVLGKEEGIRVGDSMRNEDVPHVHPMIRIVRIEQAGEVHDDGVVLIDVPQSGFEIAVEHRIIDSVSTFPDGQAVLHGNALGPFDGQVDHGRPGLRVGHAGDLGREDDLRVQGLVAERNVRPGDRSDRVHGSFAVRDRRHRSFVAVQDRGARGFGKDGGDVEGHADLRDILRKLPRNARGVERSVDRARRGNLLDRLDAPVVDDAQPQPVFRGKGQIPDFERRRLAKRRGNLLRDADERGEGGVRRRLQAHRRGRRPFAERGRLPRHGKGREPANHGPGRAHGGPGLQGLAGNGGRHARLLLVVRSGDACVVDGVRDEPGDRKDDRSRIHPGRGNRDVDRIEGGAPGDLEDEIAGRGAESEGGYLRFVDRVGVGDGGEREGDGGRGVAVHRFGPFLENGRKGVVAGRFRRIGEAQPEIVRRRRAGDGKRGRRRVPRGDRSQRNGTVPSGGRRPAVAVPEIGDERRRGGNVREGHVQDEIVAGRIGGNDRRERLARVRAEKGHRTIVAELGPLRGIAEVRIDVVGVPFEGVQAGVRGFPARPVPDPRVERNPSSRGRRVRIADGRHVVVA